MRHTPQALPVCFCLASGDSMPSGFLSTAWVAGPLCSFSPRGVPGVLVGALALLSPDINSLCYFSSKDTVVSVVLGRDRQRKDDN